MIRISNRSTTRSGTRASHHWDDVQTVGLLCRTGTRANKDGTVHAIDETIGVISSRRLHAKEVAVHLRKHWCIENNLHWTKDVVFNEDRHTLRRGNAPQVMSWLRSMCISLCNALGLQSVSDTIHNLEKSSVLLGKFLKMGAIV
jgi:predicted transposase YbfD/YdcC